jgi:hypothetical protein
MGVHSIDLMASKTTKLPDTLIPGESPEDQPTFIPGEGKPEQPESLVNETDGPTRAELEATIKELEAKNEKLNSKKDLLIEQNLKLSTRSAEAERKVTTFTVKSQRTRIFCEIMAGATANGQFAPYSQGRYPNGVKDEKEVTRMIEHYAGVAEIAAKITDERFAR